MGIFTVLNGATAKFNNYFIGGRGTGNTGSVTIAGGTLDLTSLATSTGVFGGGRMEINFGPNLGGSNVGGAFNADTKNITTVASGAGSQGIINLLGGTLTANSVGTLVAATGTGINQFNFNGGTLKYGTAAGTNAAFLANVLTGAAAGSGAYIRSGGATIDDNGGNITIAAPLLAPTGGEVTAISVSGASGFLTAPYVKIVGGNNDATAIAQIDGNGNLTSIIITNPGTGYASAPTVTLVGGTTAGGANITTGTATATVGASTSGGLTKSGGSGTLTLSGANTYTGGTTITAGRINVNSAAPLSTGTITITGNSTVGGQLFVGGTPTITNDFIISGVGFPDTITTANTGRGGAIRAGSGQTYSGTITLAGDARFGVIAGNTTNTVSGQITGAFAMDFYGALTTNAATQTFTLANIGTPSDYTGNTSITSIDFGAARTGGSAVLKLGANEQVPHGTGKGNLIFNGADANHIAVLEMNGFNETLNGVSNIAAAGAIIRNTTSGASTLTIGDADTTSAFSGVVSDGGATATLGLNKIGTGTFTLTGTNPFTGNIVITSGKLSATKFGFGASSSTRTITVESGGVLEFGTGNVFGGHFTTNVPEIIVNGGTITNKELVITDPLLIKVNNALGNVTLNNGTITATEGNQNSLIDEGLRPGEGYGAWGLNGTITSTGNSFINTGAVTGMGGRILLSSSTADTNFNVVSGTLTVSAPLQTGDSNPIYGLTKTGAGTLSLTAANLYTSNTTVNAGTLELADNAQLKFVLGAASGLNNALTGTGTVILNGDFVIDTTAADSLPSGTWTLENVSTLTGAYGASFNVVGFVDAGSNKWTKANGAKTYTFDETTGVLTLAQPGYAVWIDSFYPGETNPLIIGVGADPDGDGIPNGVEMVIGGDPKLGMDTALLPTIELVTDPVSSPAIPAGDYILFTYRRTDLSVTGGVVADCETDVDLLGVWTAATGAPGAVIQVDDNYGSFIPAATSNTDRVRVYVPRGANLKIFGRLSVVVP